MYKNSLEKTGWNPWSCVVWVCIADCYHTLFSAFQFMLQIQLSRLKLTKIVTIMPYFLVVNNTHHHLRYMEDDESADLWLNLGPHEVQHNLLFCISLLRSQNLMTCSIKVAFIVFWVYHLKTDSTSFCGIWQQNIIFLVRALSCAMFS